MSNGNQTVYFSLKNRMKISSNPDWTSNLPNREIDKYSTLFNLVEIEQPLLRINIFGNINNKTCKTIVRCIFENNNMIYQCPASNNNCNVLLNSLGPTVSFFGNIWNHSKLQKIISPYSELEL